MEGDVAGNPELIIATPHQRSAYTASTCGVQDKYSPASGFSSVTDLRSVSRDKGSQVLTES
ncbi:hypothetical protein M378DRAFT_160478, partial [Amanita muscaria Koide BX008]